MAAKMADAVTEIDVKLEEQNPYSDQRLASDGPQEAVFALPELLEQILINLDVRDLYKSRRISRQFRDIFATSPEIQTKTFFRVVEDERVVWSIMDLREREDQNYYARGPEYFVVRPLAVQRPLRPRRDYVVSVLNPILKHEKYFGPEDRFYDLINPAYRVSYRNVATGNPGEWVRFKPGLVLLPEEAPIWDQSYVSNPPCTEMSDISIVWEISLSNCTQDGDTLRRTIKLAVVKNPAGITIGELLTKALETDCEPCATEYEDLERGSHGWTITELETITGNKAVISASGFSVCKVDNMVFPK